jgi:transposase InsO family protein
MVRWKLRPLAKPFGAGEGSAVPPFLHRNTERLWRSAKHEGVYLWAPRTVDELERLLEKWFADYNRLKPHQALDGLTPWEVYRPGQPKPWERAA